MRQAELFTDIVLSDQKRKVRVAYYDSKIGSKTLLLVHGFTSFSATWQNFVKSISPEYRIICLDLTSQNELLFRHQAEIYFKFIQQLDIDKLSIVAHSQACAVTIGFLNKLQKITSIEKLILVNPILGFSEKLDFCKKLANYDANNPLVRFANEDICGYIFLQELFADKNKIYATHTEMYADYLRKDGMKEQIIQQAKKLSSLNPKNFIKLAGNINIPTLIITGEYDTLSPLAGNRKLAKIIKNSELKIINNCGHLPQLEFPEKCAKFIHRFIEEERKNNVNVVTNDTSETDNISKQQLQLRKLIENWSFSSMIILLFMKFIQLLKKMGLKANDNGWRKATGIFLQNEESKFILGSFNLKYYLDSNNIPPKIEDAKTLFISRIGEFIRQQNALHWAIEPTLLLLKRKKLNFTDIIEMTFDNDGNLIKLTPYFDNSRGKFTSLPKKDIELFFNHFIYYYNKQKRYKVNSIARKMTPHFKRWYLRRRALSFNARLDLKELIDRVLTATFITFEVLPNENDPKFMRRKFATPDVKTYRHPGWGLLNMIVRFTPDLKNSDLWVQYHHVPVDGMPMQNLLCELKKQWGETSELIYPNLTNRDSSPEIYYSGGKIFRARMFVNFSKLNDFRKFLNQNYAQEMNGQATMASLIIWGVAQHSLFKNAKVLFPVDIEEGVQFANERELSLLLIRPAKYFNRKDPFAGFLAFQREFNQRLSDTRSGNSESYEMLDLYSMVHPIFYYLAKYFFKESVSEYLGNMGLSMMKNAEMFISPISDLQRNGFLAMGNMNVPTIDGQKAGAVSICGSRKEIKAYIDAISYLADNFDSFFNMNFNNTGVEK